MTGLIIYPADIWAPDSGIDRSSMISDGWMIRVSIAYTHVGIMPPEIISDNNGRLI